MKFLCAIFCSIIIEDQIAAEDRPLSESSNVISGYIEMILPPSFYSESWDPKQPLPIILPGGKHIEEKNLIVDLDKSVKEAREKQDLLRSQRGWLSEITVGMPANGSQLELYEGVGTNLIEK